MNFLFDCGDGTVGLLRGLKRKVDIDLVAVTELSPATMSGLLMLGETHRRASKRALKLFGPDGLLKVLNDLCSISTFTATQLFEVEDMPSAAPFFESDGVYIEGVRVDTEPESTSCAYLVYEAPFPGRIDLEKAQRTGIKGAEFGRLQSGETVRGVRPRDVIGPPRRGRRLVVVGRGRPTEELSTALNGSNVAIFAAPFMDDRLELAQEAHYLTGWEAANEAERSDVGLVLLQQLGPYAPVRTQVAEARQFHRNVFAPDDGQLVRIPLPERGRPTMERQRRGAPPVKVRAPSAGQNRSR